MELMPNPRTRKHVMWPIVDPAGLGHPSVMALCPQTSLQSSYLLPCILGILFKMVNGWSQGLQVDIIIIYNADKTWTRRCHIPISGSVPVVKERTLYGKSGSMTVVTQGLGDAGSGAIFAFRLLFSSWKLRWCFQTATEACFSSIKGRPFQYKGFPFTFLGMHSSYKILYDKGHRQKKPFLVSFGLHSHDG